MASPFAARGHSIWDARSIDQADGSSVTTWAANLNGADMTNRSGGTAPLLDTDGCDGDAAVVFPNSGTTLFGSGTFKDADTDWTLLVRLERGAIIAASTFLDPATSDFVAICLLAYDANGVYVRTTSIRGGQTSADTPHTVALRYNLSADNVDIFVNGTRAPAGPWAAGSIAFENFRQIRFDAEDAIFRVQGIHVVADALTDEEVATLHTYSATLDTDYSGGVTTTVTFAGLQAGSEVRLYERSHPMIWSLDLDGATPAGCDGKVLHYEVQGASAVTVHEVWIDLDDGSATPYGATAWAGETGYTAADYVTNGGRLYVCTVTGTSAASGGPTGTGTGIEDGTCEWDYVTDFAWCDVATGNTAAQIAAAIEAVIDDDSDVTSSVTDTVISVADNRDGGPLAFPYATFPAVVTVAQEGNDASSGEEIDGVEDSTGNSWTASVVVNSPRLVDIVIVNPGWEPIRIESYLVTRLDATIPISQRVDLNYSNP